jgi:RhtB (resistance to homoserine/threonine) family protein
MVELLSVVVITLLAVISPGADFAMVTRNSMMYSRRVGLLTALGIASGVWVHVFYSMLGIGLIISQSIFLFNLIKFAGAAYLIYLGIRMLMTKPQTQINESQATVNLSSWKAFRIGFLTNTLNPKTTLFVVALFTQVISQSTPVFIQLAYGMFMSLAHLLWFCLVAYFFSSVRVRSIVQGIRHWIDRSIGGVLVLLGLTLAFSSMRKS